MRVEAAVYRYLVLSVFHKRWPSCTAETGNALVILHVVVVLRGQMWCHVESVQWKINEHRQLGGGSLLGLLTESLQVNYENVRHRPKAKFLHDLLFLVALRAKPRVLGAQYLRLSVELEALLESYCTARLGARLELLHARVFLDLIRVVLNDVALGGLVPLEHQLDVLRTRVVGAQGQRLLDLLRVEGMLDARVDARVLVLNGGGSWIGHPDVEQTRQLTGRQDVLVQRRVHLLEQQLLQILVGRLARHLHGVGTAEALA